jgi:nitrate reductase delta subunit
MSGRDVAAEWIPPAPRDPWEETVPLTVTDTDRATAWRVQALLLTYPDQRLFDRVPILRAVVRALPADLGAPLRIFLKYLENTPLLELAARYVATFDQRKRFSPHLAYFSYGDIRTRGMALVRLRQIYRAAGKEIDRTEPPDHVAVVLEFASTDDPEVGRGLLIEHRAAIELMRLVLHDIDSPWAHVLDSVSATLPASGTRAEVPGPTARPAQEQVRRHVTHLATFPVPALRAHPGPLVPAERPGRCEHDAPMPGPNHRDQHPARPRVVDASSTRAESGFEEHSSEAILRCPDADCSIVHG